MSPHRLTNIVLALIGAMVFASILSTAHLLDGPSELDAMQATADSVSDAQAAAQTAAKTAAIDATHQPATTVASLERGAQ